MGIKPEQYFRLNDGSQVKNLYELSKVLEKMPKNVFNHHVTEEKNDFSNWIKDIAGDKELAEKLIDVKTAKIMSKYINKRIKAKEAKIPQKQKSKKVEKEELPLELLKKRVKERKSQNWKNLFAKKETDLTQLTRLNCPYRNISCGWMEFLVGIIIGLTIAVILSVLL